MPYVNGSLKLYNVGFFYKMCDAEFRTSTLLLVNILCTYVLLDHIVTEHTEVLCRSYRAVSSRSTRYSQIWTSSGTNWWDWTHIVSRWICTGVNILFLDEFAQMWTFCLLMNLHRFEQFVLHWICIGVNTFGKNIIVFIMLHVRFQPKIPV